MTTSRTWLYCCDFHASKGDGSEPCANHQPGLREFFELLAHELEIRRGR